METDIGANESVSAAVLRAVSAVNGGKPDSLEPLNDVVDPDALDSLFDPRSNGVGRTGGRLSFVYSGCRITIDNGEFLTIEPFQPVGRRSAGSDGTDQGENGGSDRDTHDTANGTTPGSRVCFVCQQPIEDTDLQREQGELAHHDCRAELQCGISLGWPDRYI